MFELLLVVLFVALTPGVLFRLKGSKMMVATMHAVLFGLAVYLWGSMEGFVVNPASRPDATCPTGSTLTQVGNSDAKCIRTTQPTITNAIPASLGYRCTTGKKTKDVNGAVICATCPTGAKYASNVIKDNRRRNITAYTCNVSTTPICPTGHKVRGKKCIPTAPSLTPPLDKYGTQIYVGQTVICNDPDDDPPPVMVTSLAATTQGSDGTQRWTVQTMDGGMFDASNCRITPVMPGHLYKGQKSRYAEYLAERNRVANL